MKPVQRFSREYLESIRGVSSTEVVRFLEDFRRLHAPDTPSKLISMRVPEPLLATFKTRCKMEGKPYQARIKELMTQWLES